MSASTRPRRLPFAGALASAALLAASLLPSHAAGQPRGIHLALGADASTTATVTWFTDGADDPGSTVEYGPTPSLGLTATGQASPAPGVDALIHDVSLTGLEPGATVYYRAGGAATMSFHTAPTGRVPFRFTAFGDHGTFERSAATVQAALDADPDLALIAGDLSYANGNQPKWDTWFDLIEPLASTRPLMTAPGNHDTSLEGTSATYRARFAYPADELYFGFDYANVHVLVLHSTTSAAATEGVLAPMLAYAEQDLADAAARKASGTIDFIVVMQHHPLYGNMDAGLTGVAERNENPPLIAAEERLFQLYGVDLLIAAHNHHFERSKPMVASQPTTAELHDYVDPVGYIEVITGGGGESLYSFRDPNDVASWSAALAKCYHIMTFDVDGPTLRGTATSTDASCFIRGDHYPPGAVIDTFTITHT